MAKPIIINAKQIKKIISSLPSGKKFGAEIIKNADNSIIIHKTVTAPEPSLSAEAHDHWLDMFIVSSGRAAIKIGGKIIDKKEKAPGEWRGQKIIGAQKYLIKKNDFVIIPRGVPHQHGQGSVKMIVIKIK